ncbi:MAG: PIN domain-containing protein [Bacilli bacterium]
MDTENVQQYSFIDKLNLNSKDKIIMLISPKSKNIKVKDLKRLTCCNSIIEYEDVYTGNKNALDFQLIANLSLTIAKEKNTENSYYIVSNDNDFNQPVKYLKKKTGVNIGVLRLEVNSNLSISEINISSNDKTNSIYSKLNLNDEVLSIIKKSSALNVLHNNLHKKYGVKGTQLYKEIKPLFSPNAL